MILSVDGKDYSVYDWQIREPIRREWSARVTVGSDASVSPGARVVLDSVWSGTVETMTEIGGLKELSIVGGAGGLDADTTPRQYAGTTLGTIIADACAYGGETAEQDATGVGAWRARGKSVRQELDRVSPDWRVLPSGNIALGSAPGAAATPGRFLRARGEARTYAAEGVAPLAGRTLDGITIELALYSRSGKGAPTVTVWPLRMAKQADPSIVGGTIDALDGGRCDVTLDNGETLTDIPLFCSAGYVPDGASGVRCVVLDAADDPRNTIALLGADGTIDELALAQGKGRMLRSGDKIFIAGLVSAAPGSPVTSPPGAVVVSLDPSLQSPGDPGSGYSRVKG